MSRDHTEPTTMDEPLGTSEPTWRDDRPAGAAPPSDADDPERTIDRLPLAFVQPDDPVPAAHDAGDERTIDVDIDVLEHVRAAVRAARDGLAAPPAVPDPTGTAEPDAGLEPAAVTEATDEVAPEDPDDDQTARTAEVADADAERGGPDPDLADSSPASARVAASGIDPSLPPPPAGVATVLPPAGGSTNLPPPSGKPGLAAAVAVELADAPATAPASGPAGPAAPPTPPVEPLATPAVSPPAASPADTGPRAGRWQPPPRLRPADVRSTAPLLADRAPTRRHLDWRWAALGVLAAAVVGFLIAMALNGGDDPPDPAPGPTTAAGATTIVSTP